MAAALGTAAREDAAMSAPNRTPSSLMRPSPFRVADARPLPADKFRDPLVTADGKERACVPLTALRTLWFNTGTLCNLTCANCYIESSPINDALVYLTAAEVRLYLDEIEARALGTRTIGFTGGEPFMNREIVAMLDEALARGHDVLVLTNAMKPMRRREGALLALRAAHGARLTVRVSLDHYRAAAHEGERGSGSWAPALDGLRWLSSHGFSIAVAGRRLGGEDEADARAGYARLFAQQGIAIDAGDPDRLVLFPEMDATADVAEITTACWSILGKNPTDVMCADSRMVVHRKGEAGPRIAACTLIPYAPGFDMGATLAEATRPTRLNHPHCARFCVLGGASCSA
jgi:uncharacterized Fe-S cluster-containing radical SAM superfamily protein